MLKIRLMRIGTKKRPFYRVVVVDERAKRTGAYIELLGTYNPLTEPKDIKLEKERIDYWIKKGAQQSHGYLRMIGKAPQRPPRKPKKEKKKEEIPAAVPEAAPAEEKPAEETPANTSEGPAQSADGSLNDSQEKPEVNGNADTSEVKSEEKTTEEKKDEGSA